MCLTKAEEKSAMLIAGGVYPFPLQCTGQILQPPNPCIKIAPKQHMGRVPHMISNMWLFRTGLWALPAHIRITMAALHSIDLSAG